MIEAPAIHNSQVSALKVGVGFDSNPDMRRVAFEASRMARTALGGATPQLALVVTAGLGGEDPVASVRAVLGPVGVAGGDTYGLLTGAGLIRQGVLVVGIATEGDAASGAACAPGQDLGEAGRSAARIVMAGWPFRLRYPRGLGVAFAGVGAPIVFLEAWRQFMGPKMRTVCGVMQGGVVYGSPTARSLASVACLEASYATGLGYAEGFAPEATPDAGTLIHGAAEATKTAIKRLDERSARLVLVMESVARHTALGTAAADEWSRVVGEVGDCAPCVGWLCERVSGYGRGIQPVDEPGSLVVAAIGDPPAVTG